MKAFAFTVTAEVTINAEDEQEAEDTLRGRIYTLSDDITTFLITIKEQ